MNREILDDFDLEKQCKDYFNITLEVSEVIVRAVPTAQAAHGTVFKAGGQVYLFLASQGVQVLDDVRKTVNRMQCEAETYLPPHGEADYFERVAREKFKIMFPGKPIVSDEDLRYYKNIAPYNPALVLLGKIKGEIRGFDARAKVWRKVKDFSYSKISLERASSRPQKQLSL